MDEWIKKTGLCGSVCVCVPHKMEYYSAMRKRGNPAICEYTGGPFRHYAKSSQTKQDKYHTISLIYGI